MLYSSGANSESAWRPDTAASHREVELSQDAARNSKQYGAVADAGRSLPSRAMNRMIDHLVERKAVLTKMFVEYDTDNNGTIDAEELNNALMDLGLRLSQEEIQGIMDRLDTDGGGDIDLGEFIEHFKKVRHERFEGHIPELKQAKNELIRKLRTHAPLQIDGGAALYKMLVQIEQLQAVEHLTAEQVAELRGQIAEMVKSGMSVGPTAAQALSASVRRTAMPTFTETKKYSTGQWDKKRPKPWKIGSHEIKGPKMEMARSRKRLSTAEWQQRSQETKVAELSAGKHRAAAARPWDTRQATHGFATDSGQTAQTLTVARPRNSEWAPNGLLEEEPAKPQAQQPKQQSVGRESSGSAVDAWQKSKRKRKSKAGPRAGSRAGTGQVPGGYGTYGGGLSASRSMPQLEPMAAPLDGTGRPPLGYAPAEPAADPWGPARYSQGEMGTSFGETGDDGRYGLLGGTPMDSEDGDPSTIITDARGFEHQTKHGWTTKSLEQRGYETITNGGSTHAPIPTLHRMYAGAPKSDMPLGRQSLHPSEIRGTMEMPYRGKFATGERGPFNEFAQVSQVSGNGFDGAPPMTPSKLEVDKFLTYGLRPGNWQQATQQASNEAGLRWSTGGGTHSSQNMTGPHGFVAGGVWLE